MTDSQITKKHHPTGSLARRVLTIAMLLLVIPLFLQDLFLNRQEYQEKTQALQSYLQAVAQERALLIEQTIQLSWSQIEMSDVGCWTPDKTPNNEASFGGPNSNVKLLYIEKIPLPQGVADRFAVLSQRRKALLVGEKVSENTALIVAVPLSQLLRDLKEPYPVQMSLEEKAPPASSFEVNQPIQGTQLFLHLSVPEDHIRDLQQKSYYYRLATLIFFVGVIGGGAVYLLTRRIARPLKQLCKTMERVSEGASHARYTPDWMGFEINELGKQFNETMDGLLRHAQAAERERLGREKLAEELRIGHDIQAGLFPSHVPGLPGVDIATANVSAKEVNGDFYDLFRLENGKLLIVMCDIAGKGISACLFALGLRSMLRSMATLVDKLDEIIRRANDLFWLDAHESAMFATLWVGLYDPKTRALTYCSQGHPPALLRREGKLEELWTDGIALGAQKVDVIPTKTVTFRKEDLLVLYTDGIIEAHDPYRQLFGKNRLHEFLLRKKQATAQKIVDQLIEEVHLFSQGSPQHDDMTLLVMQFSD